MIILYLILSNMLNRMSILRQSKRSSLRQPIYLCANYQTLHFSITCFIEITYSAGAVVVVIAWQLHLQLPVQSVPIATTGVSSNLIHAGVYSIQHQVIKLVSDLRQAGGFSLGIFYLTIKQANWVRHKLSKLMKSSPNYNLLQ